MRSYFRLTLTALFLTAFLGIISQPVFADTTGFLSLINNYRTQNNLGTLTEDQNLTNSACWFAADMGAKNYFPSDHVDSLGRDMAIRLAAFGVSGGTRGENIFYTTQGPDASYAFTAWRNSPGHNANMLDSAFTRIGIGRANYSGKWYWVTDFASGTTVNLNNQCGVAVNPPALPKPAPKPAPPPTSAPVTVVQQPSSQIVIATPSASVQDLATASSTTSAKVVEIPTPKATDDNPPASGLVKGSFLVVSFLGLLALFSFIFWRLFRHFR